MDLAKNYGNMPFKKSHVAPKLKKDCIGPCNTSMIKMGLCKCQKQSPMKTKNVLFSYNFWITVAMFLMLASFFFHIGLLGGITVIAGVWIYFQYFKNNGRGQQYLQRKR